VAHKGFVWFEIDVVGRAAHGSRPDLGVDAIAKAGPILTAIAALDGDLASRTHPLLGRASVHASVIRGGEELSSYPARCVIGIERRTLPGESLADVESELELLVRDEEATARTLLAREPFEVDQASDFVVLVRATATDVLEAEPATAGASYWADSAFIAAAGIPTVVFGPGGEGAHAAEEWVSISDTEAVAQVLLAVAERFCR
jgi:acetylornithine deacetylase